MILTVRKAEASRKSTQVAVVQSIRVTSGCSETTGNVLQIKLDHLTVVPSQVSSQFKQQGAYTFFYQVVLPSAQPLTMPESPDPCNTFEVTVSPLLSQDQTFNFTFRLACPGPVVCSIFPPFTTVLVTHTYQTLKISVGPHPTGPVDTPRISVCTPAPPSSTSAKKPSVAPHVSVRVSPNCVQCTQPQTLMSRVLSPIPFKDIQVLPPNITAFFASTQMQPESTQVSFRRSFIQLADSDIISLTSSESDSEKIQDLPVLQSRTQACSPEPVVGNHWQKMIAIDPLVCPCLLLSMSVSAHTNFPDSPDAVG